MSRIAFGDAKETTSQSILTKVNTIDGKITSANLENVSTYVADFLHDQVHIIKGGLDSNARIITV